MRRHLLIAGLVVLVLALAGLGVLLDTRRRFVRLATP
jgi:hypothetical protein